MCKFLKNKRLTNSMVQFYAVFSKAFSDVTADDTTKILTFTSTEADAVEFLHTFLRWTHNVHFTQWCSLKQLSVEDARSWRQYIKDGCISVEELKDYAVGKIYFSKDELSTVLRMHNNCVALGCSYESEKERMAFIQKIKADKAYESVDFSLIENALLKENE